MCFLRAPCAVFWGRFSIRRVSVWFVFGTTTSPNGFLIQTWRFGIQPCPVLPLGRWSCWIVQATCFMHKWKQNNQAFQCLFKTSNFDCFRRSSNIFSYLPYFVPHLFIKILTASRSRPWQSWVATAWPSQVELLSLVGNTLGREGSRWNENENERNIPKPPFFCYFSTNDRNEHGIQLQNSSRLLWWISTQPSTFFCHELSQSQ